MASTVVNIKDVLNLKHKIFGLSVIVLGMWVGPFACVAFSPGTDPGRKP